MESKRIKLTIYTRDIECIATIRGVAKCSTAKAIRIALRKCAAMLDQEECVDVKDEIASMFDDFANWQMGDSDDQAKQIKGHGKKKRLS